MIHLDSNATTKPSSGVCAAVRRALESAWANPSSVHRAGQAARHEVELARERLATLIGASAREILLTGTATEALDLAIRSRVRPPSPGAGLPEILTSQIEHAAIRDLCEALEKERLITAVHAPVSQDGVIDAVAIPALISDRTAGAVFQWANNETGAIQPLDAIGAALRARRVPFIVDGTQWVGRMPTDVSHATFDMLCFAPHKFHGPKGVGVLWCRRGVGTRPTIHGAQELGRRGGTENVPGIAGAGVAAEEAAARIADPAVAEGIRRLRDHFEQTVLRAIPDARVNGPVDPPETPLTGLRRLFNTTNIAFPRLEAEAILLAISERGVNASAGAACSSGSLEPSPVLLAMGIPPALAHGSVRFSLDHLTTRAEVDEAAAIVIDRVRALSKTLGAA